MYIGHSRCWKATEIPWKAGDPNSTVSLRSGISTILSNREKSEEDDERQQPQGLTHIPKQAYDHKDHLIQAILAVCLMNCCFSVDRDSFRKRSEAPPTLQATNYMICRTQNQSHTTNLEYSKEEPRFV